VLLDAKHVRGMLSLMDDLENKQPDTANRFELSRVSGQRVSDAELLADLSNVATKLGATTVSLPQYKQHGRYDGRNLSRRFGSWNKALLAVGLTISNEIDISDERLFENILILWQHYGRQPRRSELATSPSTISQSPYSRRFRSWMAALRAFIEYANATGVESAAVPQITDGHHATKRDPSLRLRWKVLQRDRFTCRGCGRSPALIPGVELHVDHIEPWSSGGETILENLQTLCSLCNLGKSNVLT
jgi:hypothetical protein